MSHSLTGQDVLFMESNQSQRPSDLLCCDKPVMDANIDPVQSALSPICSRRRFIKGVASSISAALIDNSELPKTFQKRDYPVLFLCEQDQALFEESPLHSVKFQPWTRSIFNAIPHDPITLQSETPKIFKKVELISHEEPAFRNPPRSSIKSRYRTAFDNPLLRMSYSTNSTVCWHNHLQIGISRLQWHLCLIQSLSESQASTRLGQSTTISGFILKRAAPTLSVVSMSAEAEKST